MSYQVLKLERTGHVATITFNRPEVMNALDRHLTQEIHQVLDEVAEEFPAIRVVLITGEGRGFCSGADLAQMRDSILKGDAFRTPAPTDEAGRRFRRSRLTCDRFLSRLLRPSMEPPPEPVFPSPWHAMYASPPRPPGSRLSSSSARWWPTRLPPIPWPAWQDTLSPPRWR